MEKFKKYLLSRSESLTAWLGVIGFILEIALHLGNISTIMLMLFILLVVLPEASFREIFNGWTKQIKDRNP